MVKPNIKVYTIVYFTPETYGLWKGHINEMAKRYKTKISYDFKEQFFNIVGNSQDACNRSRKKIQQLAKLLIKSPNALLMTEAVDFHNRDDLDSLFLHPKKPASMKEDKPHEVELKVSDSLSSSESDDEGYVLYFIFAKNIKDPYDVLLGPPDANSKRKDYLAIIGRDTKTKCSLREERKVKIIGPELKQVEKAFHQFMDLQKRYKARRLEANINNQNAKKKKKQSSNIISYSKLGEDWKKLPDAPNRIRDAPDEKPLWREKGYIENQTEKHGFLPDNRWSNPRANWVSSGYNSNYPTLPKERLEKPGKAQHAKQKKGSSQKENPPKKRKE